MVLICTIFTACGKTTTKNSSALQDSTNSLHLYCCDYQSLNPLFCKTEANSQVLRLIFDSLIICDQSQNPTMCLAQAYSLSNDGTILSIKLKNNVEWHDGTPFTSKDVKLSFEDVLAVGVESPYYSNLQNIDYINTPNDLSLNIKLKSPQVNFINLLDVPIVKYHNGEEFKAIGTGAYILKDEQKKSLYLTSNENWYNSVPKIKNIEVKILPDNETSVYSYDSKEVDFVSISDSLEFGKYTSNSNSNIVDYPSRDLTFLAFNIENDTIKNKKIRKAIAYSINKDKIASEVLLSHGSVANTCMNSKWWVYNEGANLYPYNINKSITLFEELNESGEMPTIEILVNDDNKNKIETAEIIKNTLTECGVIAYVQQVDWETYSKRIADGEYQIYIGRLNYSADINPKYLINNPSNKMADLLSKLNYQTKNNEIKNTYFEIQKQMAEELQIVPIYFNVNTIMYSKRVKGIVAPTIGNIYNNLYDIELSN